MPRCQCLENKNKRCKNEACKSGQFCKQHQNCVITQKTKDVEKLSRKINKEILGKAIPTSIPELTQKLKVALKAKTSEQIMGGAKYDSDSLPESLSSDDLSDSDDSDDTDSDDYTDSDDDTESESDETDSDDDSDEESDTDISDTDETSSEEESLSIPDTDSDEDLPDTATESEEEIFSDSDEDNNLKVILKTTTRKRKPTKKTKNSDHAKSLRETGHIGAPPAKKRKKRSNKKVKPLGS